MQQPRDTTSERTWFAFAGPLIIAAINVGIAAVLGWSAANGRGLTAIVIGFVVVTLLSVAQALLWRWVHARLPLSLSYPMTSMMYPGFAALAWLQTGSISLMQIAGVAVVMVAIALLMQARDL